MGMGSCCGPDLGRVHKGGYDVGRRFRVEGIAVTPQSSQAGGILMSQRECPALNWPIDAVRAEEPVRVICAWV